MTGPLPWYWLPALALLTAVFPALLFHGIARARRNDNDCGDFWTHVITWFGSTMIILLLASSWIEALYPPYWQEGKHLYLDLTPHAPWDWDRSIRFLVALGAPAFLWILSLTAAAIRKPDSSSGSRWLAGAVGYREHRYWVLPALALPLALILVTQYESLDRGSAGYPAATWMSTALLALSLVMLAFTRGTGEHPPAAAATPEAVRPELGPWPTRMRDMGIDLHTLASWPPTRESPLALNDAASRELARRLEEMGASLVAPQAIQAVAELIDPARSLDTSPPVRLLIAPDDCGQAETVALAAALLHRRFHLSTLLVVRSEVLPMVARIGTWLQRARGEPASKTSGIASIEGPKSQFGYEPLWILNAQGLSDHFIARLQDPELARRIGLVVWWDLHGYSGVLAANLWATSRRFYRLLRAHGHPDVRTLALARRSAYAGTQLPRFVQSLLPHRLAPDLTISVGRRFQREIQLHRLDSHERYFQQPDHANIAEPLRHRALVAARASLEVQWPTYLDPPEGIPEEDLKLLELPAGPKSMGEQLQGSAAQAGARILTLHPGETLSLLDMIGRGGRCLDDSPIHHVGLLDPDNAYARHLLTRLGRQGGDMGSAQKLVATTEPHRDIVRRHLRLAVSELPDTRTNLLKDFLWRPETVTEILDRLYRDGMLKREEARFLHPENNRLVVEPRYQSLNTEQGVPTPLDTLGRSLIAVRDRTGGQHLEGVRMWVDADRLSIRAYPGRVFVSGGRRFEVGEWHSVAEAQKTGWISCKSNDTHSKTWRIRTMWVSDLVQVGSDADIGGRAETVHRIGVTLTYGEQVTGIISVRPDLTSGKDGFEDIKTFPGIQHEFPSRGVVLAFQDCDDLAAEALAEALRQVLPVHLGLDEDAVDVVAILGVSVGFWECRGVVIVDLYPEGIGVIDTINEDDLTLKDILRHTYDWLRTCPCRDDYGCPDCLRSPTARATNQLSWVRRDKAVELLSRMF